MIKRILALLLILSLVFVFVACDKGEKTGENTPTKAPSEETPTETQDPDSDGKYMDYQGAGGIIDYRLPFYQFTSNKVVLLSSADTVSSDASKFNALRDVYDIQLEITQTTVFEIMTKYVAMYMADESPDLARFGLPTSLISKEYVAPWEKYINFDMGIWKDIKDSVDNLWFKGHIYTIFNTPARWDNVVWYNKDLFAEAGVKTPTEYYEEGNWTWDTFRECALNMHTDSDSDGIPEIWGCAIEPVMFIYTTGYDFISLEKGGTVKNNILSEEIARGINYYTDMVTKDACVYDGSDGGTAFGQGKIAMMSANCWVRTFFPELLKAEKVAIVPYPKDPNADRYYLGEGFMAWNLSTKAINPEGAAAFVCSQRYHQLMSENDAEQRAEAEAMTLSEQIDINGWSLEMDDFVRNEISSDKFTPVLVVAEAFDFPTQFNGDVWFRPQMGEPWATIAEEIAPKIDQLIAERMEE